MKYHIDDNNKKVGPFDDSSCFPFENCIKSLKKMISQHQKHLEQVVNQYQEFLECSNKLMKSNLFPYCIKFKKPYNDMVYY